MTRGRHDNTALVCTDLDAPEHGPAPPPPAPIAVLAHTLQRVTAERTAIEELRDRLAASESLAVLKPRLANLEGWIQHHAPPRPQPPKSSGWTPAVSTSPPCP